MGLFSCLRFPRLHQAGREDAKYGFQVLCDPEHAVVDLVFVHGLTGDREGTWTASGSPQPWPQTLLPTKIPNARILTYGYDASVVKLTRVVSSNAIGSHSSTLLAALATARDADEETMNRPIIFIAHSLGGLVCQDALCTAALSGLVHYTRILESTRGVALMGTPLSGSDFAAAAERLARWLKLVKNTNSRILTVLRHDSEVADRIQSAFNGLLESGPQQGRQKINVTCFYEELPLDVIGDRVVPRRAATHHPWEQIGIHSNHMDMVRFTSDTDNGFVLLVGVLKRWIGGLHAQNETTQETKPRGQPRSKTALQKHVRSDTGESSVSIGGSVTGSNVVGGSQTVHGALSIGK